MAAPAATNGCCATTSGKEAGCEEACAKETCRSAS
jgi:hypothetical protein